MKLIFTIKSVVEAELGPRHVVEVTDLLDAVKEIIEHSQGYGTAEITNVEVQK